MKEIRRRLCVSESKLMMLCDSEHIVKCFDVYENRWLKIMVLEYCNGGDLQAEINGKLRIPEREAILILKQLINGIAVRLCLARKCITIRLSTATSKPKTYCRTMGCIRSRIWAFRSWWTRRKSTGPRSALSQQWLQK